MLILKILMGLFGLTLVVIAHELGHFLVAKLCGIEVVTFSVGFGKKLISITRGKTEYCLSLIPLGGYCRLKGEQSLIQAWEKKLDEIPKEEGALYSAHPLARIAMAFAGPLFSFLFAILIFSSINLVGYEIPYQEPRIVLASEIITGSETMPADKAGLKTGDIIEKIQDQSVLQFSDMEEIIALSPGDVLPLTVNRNGEILKFTVTPDINKEKGSGYIGVFAWSDPVINTISEKSAASLAGLKKGDRIIKVDGKDVSNTAAVSYYIQDENEKHILTVLRDANPLDIVLLMTPGSNPGIQFEYKSRKSSPLTPLKAIAAGTTETIKTLMTTLKSFRLLTKGVGLKNAVSGPLRITYYTGEMASYALTGGVSGIVNYFQFLAFISVALFFMNLLPIPVLDGGQIVLFLFEMIKRSPLKPKMIYRYQVFGTFLVFALMIAATASDIFFFAVR